MWPPPSSTRTDTLFPYTTLFRSDVVADAAAVDEAVLQARAGTRVADHRQVDQQAAHVAVLQRDRLAALLLDAALPLRGMRVPVVGAVDLLAQEQALADRALGERAELSADVVQQIGRASGRER